MPLSLRHPDESDTPTGSPVDEPDMLSTSSEEESDVHYTSANPTPLPHPSPQPGKPQLVKQNSLPTQQISEDLSKTPLRKLSTPFHPTARSVTPTVTSGDSPSLSRRPPLVYTPQHTLGEGGGEGERERLRERERERERERKRERQREREREGGGG